jgi:putative ABC transport system substrate-binding protein
MLASHAGVADPTHDQLREGLRAFGYEDGKNIRVEIVTAAGHLDRVQALADGLVRQDVDVIVCANEATIRAALKATGKIPIVMTGFGYDPVALGLVDSLGRPRGNLTGIHSLLAGLDAKRLEILKEALPRLARVAVFWEAPFGTRALDEVRAAGRPLGLQVELIEVHGAQELEAAFKTAKQKRVTAASFIWSPTFAFNHDQLAALSIPTGLPMIGVYLPTANPWLLAYGTDTWESFRRAGYFIDRLLKGARPADLPIEQLSRYKLAINLKTASVLGVKLPQSILLRADEVVQ